jgi:hypothetical protein
MKMKQDPPLESLKRRDVRLRSPDPLVSSGIKRRSRSLAALDALNFFQAMPETKETVTQ